MRGSLLVVILTTAALAGCLSNAETDDVGLQLQGLGNDATHPAYGYLSYLPDADVDPASLPPLWVPPAARALPDPLERLHHFAAVDGVSGGAGIALFGSLAFVGPTRGPLHIVDVSDPMDPQLQEVVDAPARDVDTIAYPDGRLVAVTTGGGRNMFFTDVTDPRAPHILSTIETPHSNHNLAVVPGTPIVYNSPSGGTFTDIIDATDPTDPKVVKEWENGYGCHDITFYMSQEEAKYRGYCAGFSNVQIWDVVDPMDPQIVTDFGWPALGQHDFGDLSLLTWAHLAMPDDDASILILGDETGGGAVNGCDFNIRREGVSEVGPLGNLWFYDISDETAPVLKGHVSPSYNDALGETCTAHFGRVVEDTDHMVVGFYGAGVLLVDFTDPDDPVIKHRMDREGSNIWDAWYYQGYVFTGDIGRGMDVLSFL